MVLHPLLTGLNDSLSLASILKIKQVFVPSRTADYQQHRAQALEGVCKVLQREGNQEGLVETKALNPGGSLHFDVRIYTSCSETYAGICSYKSHCTTL